MTRVRISMLAAGATALIALGATACGDITENGDPDKNGNGGDARNAAEVHDDPAALDGRTFVSTKVSTGSADTPSYLGSVEVELSFEKNAERLTGGVGCNGLSGELSATGGTLSLDAIARTEMACEEPLMRQEEWLVRLLESDPSWEMTEDDQLRLGSDGTEVLLVEQAEAMDNPAGLRDVTWKLDSVADAGAGPDGTARHSAAMEAAELKFAAIGKANGDDGDDSGDGGDSGERSGQDGSKNGSQQPGEQRHGEQQRGGQQPGEAGAEPVRVQGTGGCNGFGGQAVIEPARGGADSQRPSEYDGRIDFGKLTSTMKACTDDEVMRVEQEMMTTLSGTVPYSLTEDTLTLHGDEHELTFSGH